MNINDTGILRAESENLVYKDRFGDTHYLIHDDSLKTINGYSLIGNGDIIINNDSKKFIFTPQFTFDEDSFEEYKNADEFYCYDAESDIYIELYKSPSDGDWVYLSGGTINSETLITVRVSFDKKDVSTCIVNIEKLRVTNIVSDMLTDAGFQQPIEYAITKPIYDGMVLESLYVEPWSTRSLKLDCTSFAEEMYYLYRGSESYEETYLIRFYGYYDNRNIICVTVDLITFTGLLNLIPIGGVSGIQDEGTYIDFTKPINIKDGFFFDTEHAANGKLICDDVGIHYEILAGNPLSEPATIDIIHTGDGTKFLSDDGTYKEVNGGGITIETDPIFSASPAATITNEKKAEWDNKVDKVEGKGLSTEDFTTTLKGKLEGLSNYDDTELSNALLILRRDFDKLVNGDTTTAIKTFNEIIAFLDGIQDTQDLSSIIASIEQQIAGKMDKVTLAAVATSGSYNDLSNKPTIPTKLSELDNDDGYIKPDIAGDVGLTDSIFTEGNILHVGSLRFSRSQLFVHETGAIETYDTYDDTALYISTNGNGTKFLADNGKYKTALTEH